MNKKVLSALLFGALMAGTGTFTSCIDNDEPAGIEQLRGAKAELVKAQAALTLADEAFRMAEVANQELLNEAQRLANKYAEIENEIHELDVELKRLEVEKAEAATEVAKAEAEAKIAKAQYDKQIAEQKMAWEAENFKAKMAESELATLRAQADLEKYLAEVELAKLTLTQAERNMLENAQGYLARCASNLDGKYQTLKEAQKNFDQALLGQAGGMSLSKLTAKLAKENAALNVQEVLLKETEEMLALAKNFDEETWSEQMAKLDADIQEAKKNEGEAEVALTKIKVGAEYQDADDAYVAAVEELGEQQATKGAIDEYSYSYTETAVTTQNVAERENYTANYQTVGNTQEKTLAAKYVAAKTDSTAAMDGTLTINNVANATNFAVKGYKNEVPEALKRFLVKSNDFKKITGYTNTWNGEFAYGNVEKPYQTYTEGDYQEDLAERAKDEDYVYTSNAAIYVESLEAWIEALGKFSPDANAQEWQKFQLAEAKETAATAKADYETALAAWNILVDVVKNEKKTAAPTNRVIKDENDVVTFNGDIDGAVDAYNTAYANVLAAITAHNTALDAWKAEEDAFKATAKEAAKTELKKTFTDNKIKAYYKDIFNKVKTDVYGTTNPVLKYADLLDVDGAKTAYGALGTDPSIEKIQNVVVLFAKATGTEGQTGYKTAAQNAATINAAVQSYATNEANVHYADAANAAALETAANDAVTTKLSAEYAKTAANSTLVTKKNAVVAPKTTTPAFAGGTIAKLETANAEIVTKWNALMTAYESYIDMLWSEYAQKVTAKNLTKIGTDAIATKAYVKDLAVQTAIIEKDFGYNAIAYTTLKKADGTTEEAAIIGGYKKYQAAGSDISAAEEANLSVTAIDVDHAKVQVKDWSETIYGPSFPDQLLPLTESDIEDYVAANNITDDIDGTNFGLLGAKMAADAEVALYEDMQDVEELVAPIKTALETQLAALKAEIAANSAIVAEYVKAADEAWAAVLAGRTAVETALAARDAIAAEAQAAKDAAVDLALELNAIKAEAKKQLDNLKPQNANIEGEVMSVEKLVAYWEVELANKAERLESLKSQIAETEKAIEMFEAGNYTEAYNVEYCKTQLEVAQKAYDAAYAVYQNAVAEMEAILEALTK